MVDIPARPCSIARTDLTIVTFPANTGCGDAQAVERSEVRAVGSFGQIVHDGLGATKRHHAPASGRTQQHAASLCLMAASVEAKSPRSGSNDMPLLQRLRQRRNVFNTSLRNPSTNTFRSQ
jgi:hypothetical protein